MRSERKGTWKKGKETKGREKAVNVIKHGGKL